MFEEALLQIVPDKEASYTFFKDLCRDVAHWEAVPTHNPSIVNDLIGRIRRVGYAKDLDGEAVILHFIGKSLTYREYKLNEDREEL